MNRCSRYLCLAVFLAGCGDAVILAPAARDNSTFSPQASVSGVAGVTVLNWNVYIGANVDPIIVALATPDPTDDLPALLAGIATFQATDFPARAEAIADQIARARPHVVGLQEVTTLEIDLRPLGIPTNLNADFLTILQAALVARGLHYALAASVTNLQIDLPLPAGAVVRSVDHDALLVDPARVAVQSTVAQNFAANLGDVGPIELIRGFVAIAAAIDGRTYAFANTHLEPDLSGASLAPLRAAQTAELLGAVGAASSAILMGDFNDEPGSPMHQLITGAGFTDTWAALRPGAAGLTCCHAADLSNPHPTFDQRIDYIFVRGAGHPIAGVTGRIDRLGEVPADRLSGPLHRLWPSDHAGLVSDLRIPPARARR